MKKQIERLPIPASESITEDAIGPLGAFLAAKFIAICVKINEVIDAVNELGRENSSNRVVPISGQTSSRANNTVVILDFGSQD